MLVDTHCHIHEPIFQPDADEALIRARQAGVDKVICVGTSEESSRLALDFSATRENVYASVGVHPHDTKDGYGQIKQLVAGQFSDLSLDRVTLQGAESSPVAFGLDIKDVSQALTRDKSENRPGKLVAIGEVGLDYFYTHSPKEVQIKALEEQLQLALDYHLPVIFHVRDAFTDFWPILDNFPGIRGELHSFTDNRANLEEGLERGLYIGVNGISTFTKDQAQQELFAQIPLENLLLETDAPFLTPAPFRGKVNEPAFVREVARFHADARGVLFDELASKTTANATALFAL